MPRGMWGAYRMGVNGTHNIVGENVGAYNIVCVREVIEYCFYRCTEYGPWYRGLTCAPCLTFLRSFPGPFQAGVPGRLVRVGSGCASRRRAASRVFAYPDRRRGVGVGDSALPGLPVGETIRRRLETEVSALVGEVGQSRQAGAPPPWLDLLAGDWIALLACSF